MSPLNLKGSYFESMHANEIIWSAGSEKERDAWKYPVPGDRAGPWPDIQPGSPHHGYIGLELNTGHA